MKMGSGKSFRAVLTLVLMLLAAGFLWAGIPALAANDMTEIAGRNMNPIAKDLEYATFRNISIHGRFSAVDPDGDAVTFEVSGVPKKGTVQAEKDGSFIYTPGENKKGRDTFSYHAIDTNGNISNKATVAISINKQSTKSCTPIWRTIITITQPSFWPKRHSDRKRNWGTTISFVRTTL